MKFLRENWAIIGGFGAFVVFAMTVLATKGDIETMTAPLATKADVAALPTRADVDAVSETAVTLRETVAALGATVSALSTTVDAQRETIDVLRAAVDTQRQTVGQVNATVLALSGTVDRLNEAAGTVGALDGRLDTLTGIVAPLVPCILELHRSPAGDVLTGVDLETSESGLPESCQLARLRARGQ